MKVSPNQFHSNLCIFWSRSEGVCLEATRFLALYFPLFPGHLNFISIAVVAKCFRLETVGYIDKKRRNGARETGEQ